MRSPEFSERLEYVEVSRRPRWLGRDAAGLLDKRLMPEGDCGGRRSGSAEGAARMVLDIGGMGKPTVKLRLGGVGG